MNFILVKSGEINANGAEEKRLIQHFLLASEV